MDFATLQSQVIGTRFNENQRTSVKYWINATYARLWASHNWPFKDGGPTTVGVTASTVTVDTSGISNLMRPKDLQRDDGYQLRYLRRREYDYLYAGSTSTGTPYHYTMINRTLYLGPIPSETASYTLLYEKRLTELSADADVPAFDSEFHMILVFGASAMGLMLENDPTWDSLDAQYREMLTLMTAHYLPHQAGENRQYGGPTFYATL